jgi:hypothetical protein
MFKEMEDKTDDKRRRRENGKGRLLPDALCLKGLFIIFANGYTEHTRCSRNTDVTY